MTTIPESLAIAVQHHQAGRLQTAEQIYRQILTADPKHINATHLLGVLFHQMGRHEAAVEQIERAIRLNGNVAPFHGNLGGAYYALQRIPAAIACYRRALKLKPDYAEAHNNLGNALKDQGKLDEAVDCYRKALKLKENYAEAAYNLGNALQILGKSSEAAASFRKALKLAPDFVPAHNNLGIALKDQGKLDEAVACYRRALELQPDFVAAHNNLGIAFQRQGKLDDAVACYRRVLELQPDHVEAHNNLGNALKDLRKLDAAVDCYRRGLALRPDFAEAHNNLGNALKEKGNLDEAVACYRRALELRPDYAEGHNNLGAALQDLEELDEAVACYRRALELRPDYAEGDNNLGTAFQDQGNLNEASRCFRRALDLQPDFAEAHNNLGTVFQGQGKLIEAVGCYRRALDLQPDFAEAHNNLGVAFDNLGKLDEAVACFRRVLELEPDHAQAHVNLGNTLKQQGRLDEAAASYRRALDIQPDFAAAIGSLLHVLQLLCRWEDLPVLARRAIEIADRAADGTIGLSAPPFAFLVLPIATTAEQQRRFARQWLDRRLKAKRALEPDPPRHRPSASKPKITIGYLSADFHSHATAVLIAELIEKHDRDRFAVAAYSYSPDDRSPMRSRLVSAFDRFVEVKDASFADAAEHIAADAVDILVDLKGYTRDARPEILALRPAPIQVNYLGYPGTMGAEFIDYILVDDYVVPSDQQPFFTERLVHLPGCYQVNDSRREISARRPTREECGLPAEGFVFCSFNNSYKITPPMFDLWMRLLKAVPESVLWILESNPWVPANLRREAEARGVEAKRLVLAPHRPSPEHLARHRLADLFLDSFPVNAHTTASDALWAGCPLLTLAGQTFISRVAGSLLRTIGLPELIATSLEDYEATALRLARNPGQLADLRARLAANRAACGLFDGGRFARNLETAYATMWEIHRAGEKPRAFAVGPR